MKNRLTKKEVKELQELLCSWEDDNISDYEYCNQVGDLLGLGKWTWKGYKERLNKEELCSGVEK